MKRHEISAMRENMWIAVVVFSIFGDVFTTWFGVVNPDIYERNTLWMEYFNNGNFAALFVFKVAIVGTLLTIDLILVRTLGAFAFPAIPIYLLYSGMTATFGNLGVLQASGTNITMVYIVLIVATVAWVQFTKRYFGYEFNKERDL